MKKGDHMRFEELDPKRQHACFLTWYDALNKKLYNGALEEIPIYIGGDLEEALPAELDISNVHALYISIKNDKRSRQIFENVHGIILFRHSVIDFVKDADFQKHQIWYLTALLLHEMAHHYCDINNIDDTGHSKAWMEVASTHGLLLYVNENGNYDEGHYNLNDAGREAIKNFRIR